MEGAGDHQVERGALGLEQAGDLGLDRLEFGPADPAPGDARLVGDGGKAETAPRGPADQRCRARLQRHIFLVFQIVDLAYQDPVAVEEQARLAVAARRGVGRKPDIVLGAHQTASMGAEQFSRFYAILSAASP